MKKIVKFIRECVLEMQKVSWPTKAEVTDSTKVVVISVIFIAIILGALDYILFYGLNFIM